MKNVKRTEKKHSANLCKGWKRVFSVMLAILMTVFVIDDPGIIKVKAQAYAASVTDANGDTTNYETVMNAIAYTKTKPNSTVTLLKDSLASLEVESGTFTIDLNGKTLEGAGERNTLFVRGNAKITIKDSKVGDYLKKTSSGDFYAPLYVIGTASVSLERGKFDTVRKDAETYDVGVLLAEGYAYQDSNTGAWITNTKELWLDNVTVKAIPVKFTKQPEGTTVSKNVPTSKTLSVTVETVPETSGATFEYQWYKNGNAIDNYAYTAITDSSTTATPQLQELMKALYLYHQEADNYKNNN